MGYRLRLGGPHRSTQKVQLGVTRVLATGKSALRTPIWAAVKLHLSKNSDRYCGNEPYPKKSVRKLVFKRRCHMLSKLKGKNCFIFSRLCAVVSLATPMKFPNCIEQYAI